MRNDEVSLIDLRAALDLILRTIELQHGDTITLTADYYWKILGEAVYSHDAELPRLSIGACQLSDDVDEMQEMLMQDHEVLIRHDLEHLVGILLRLAFQN